MDMNHHFHETETPLCTYGELADSMAFLINGEVRIALPGPEDEPFYMWAPCWVGDSCLFTNAENPTRTADVIASSDVEALWLGKAEFRNVLALFPGAQSYYIATMLDVSRGDWTG